MAQAAFHGHCSSLAEVMAGRSVAAQAWALSSSQQAGVMVGGKVGPMHLDKRTERTVL